MRLTGALLVTLALLAVSPAFARAALTRDAQRVYDDYRSDGAIEPCDHTPRIYRATLDQVTPDIEEETPAFRPAVEAALEEREDEKCPTATAPEQGGQPTPAAGSSGGGSGSAAPSSSSGGGSAPAPAPNADSGSGSAAPATPSAPATGGAAPAASGTGTGPPEPASPAPARPLPTTPTAPVGAADPVLLDRPYAGTPTGLLIAAALIGLALLAALAALAVRRLGWGEERLAPARHAWGEAAYRTTATWGDFVDWLRLGR